MTHLLWIYVALVGACIGSFLNVAVFRLPEGLSVVRPRSRCGACGHTIRARDNVPVFGWLFLRGRCRDCGSPISPQYPLVEAATALLWVLAFVWFGWGWEALAAAIFFSLLLGIALTDLRTYIIPDEFSLGGLTIGLALSFAPGGLTPQRALLGAAMGFGLLYAVAVLGEWAFRKPAMGGGDIKMMAMVGAFTGPLGVPITVFLGALLGTVVFGPISWRTGKLVPFGIFLAVGAAVTLPFGEEMRDWYLRTVLGG